MLVYKIRDKKTGLFSTGTSYPNFTKEGKTWSKINHVQSHITMYLSTLQGRYIGGGRYEPCNFSKTSYANCEIVTYELTEVNTKGILESRENKNTEK